MAEPARRRKFWGWGWEDGGLSLEHTRGIGRTLAERFGVPTPEPRTPPRLADVSLRAPRVRPADPLAALVRSDAETRASHTYGKSFRDVVRAVAGDFTPAPDLVAYPRDEADVVRLLDWATSNRVAVIPFGGGSSVVGGVEAAVGGAYAGTMSLDLAHLDRVVEVDTTSRAARIQAGVFGPSLEEQLRPHGLTLRHFPQSFEFSTLGGWVATRSGGHYATLYTHIDDFVESLRVVTPAGVSESRRLPGSGAGPSPDRLFIGSEGMLGVIVEAWMRLQARPVHRATASATFDDFLDGAQAARALGQAGLYPSNCRLLDPGEAELAGVGAGKSVLLVAFESGDHPLDAWMERALECVADHGGQVPPGSGKSKRAEEGARDGAAGAWRRAFLDGPYLRDALVLLGMVSETFETAITWDRFVEFHEGVRAATEDAVRRVCGAGRVTCRFTHVYPDGPAPYYTVVAPGRTDALLAQWAEIKQAAADAIIRLGGTITHHHAVGRDHRPWYDRQRPEPFAAALRATKRALDPAGVLNPGVLIDPAA
jgi:alkyldihydroxyacetonephosphate synthase